MQNILNNTKAVAIEPKATTPVKAKRVRKSAKPENAVAQIDVSTANEAKPDPRAARSERIAAERTTIGTFFSAYGSAASVPVKSVTAFKLSPTTVHPIARRPSERQCAAICAAFAAAGAKLETGATAPRIFNIDGVNSAIENGVLRDITSSGLATVSGASPESEIIKLSNKAVAIITGLIGEKTLKAAKLI